MTKITLTPVASLANEQSFLTTTNNNYETIENASDNFLSRDGTAPNQMAADLDMNSHRILNLPAPSADTEPLRRADLTAFTSGTLVLNQNAQLYETRAVAAATVIPTTVTFVQTAGYTTVGDGGGALYKKRVGTPSHTGFFTSSNGTVYEIAEVVPNIKQFGANGTGGDDTAAFTGAFQWLNLADNRSLYIPAGNYGKTGTHTANHNGTRIFGDGGRVSVILQNDDNNSIVFANSTPTTGIILGFSLEGIGIRRNNGSSANTGVDLKIVGGFQFVIRDVNMFNAVNGIDLQGGDNGVFEGVQVYGNNDILVRRTGSSLVKIGSQLNGAAINNHADSMFFSDCNFSGVNNRIDYALQITGGDGLLFSNSHMGLTGQACCLLNPSSIAGDFFSSIAFDSVFFDGSAIAQQVFAIQSGNAGQSVTHTKLNNCQIGGGTTNGLVLDYPTTNTAITGCNIDSNTNFGFILNGGGSTTNLVFTGNIFSGNGTNYSGNALNNASVVIRANNPDMASVQTTPTVTATSGAFTTVASTVNKTQIGKLVFFDVSIAITTNGTAAGGIQILSFGTTPVREVSVNGKIITTGKDCSGRLNTSGQLVDIFQYDATYPGADGRVLKLSGFCEVA